MKPEGTLVSRPAEPDPAVQPPQTIQPEEWQFSVSWKRVRSATKSQGAMTWWIGIILGVIGIAATIIFGLL